MENNAVRLTDNNDVDDVKVTETNTVDDSKMTGNNAPDDIEVTEGNAVDDVKVTEDNTADSLKAAAEGNSVDTLKPWEDSELENGLLYEYHKLEEKEHTRVNKCWSRLQIALFALSTVFSLMAFVFISDVIIFFDNNCIFYAKKIVFQNITEDHFEHSNLNITKRVMIITREGLMVDFIKSDFSRVSKCFMPYFFPILSIICSVTWLAVFLMFRNLKHPWRIVIPALVFTSIFSLISYGYQGEFMRAAFHFQNLLVNASVAADLTNNYEVQELSDFVNIYVSSMFVNSLFWTLGAILLIVRIAIAADFNYVRVRVQVVKLNPEDVPLLSKYFDELDPSPPTVYTPEVTHEKRLLSILKSSKNMPQRTRSVVDSDESDVMSEEQLTPSTRVIVNPMTVAVDIETGRKGKRATMQMDTPSAVALTSYDASVPSTSKNNLPLITDSPTVKTKPSTPKINVNDEEIVSANDDDDLQFMTNLIDSRIPGDDQTKISSKSSISGDSQIKRSSKSSTSADDPSKRSSKSSIPGDDQTKRSSKSSTSADDPSKISSESSIPVDPSKISSELSLTSDDRTKISSELSISSDD